MTYNDKQERYTQQQSDVGDWVRELSRSSRRGWKAFYHTKEWSSKRQAVLVRDKGACRRCRSCGRYTPATTVHHIRHLRDAPELALEDTNLISLCSECHEALHPEKHKRKGFVNVERW